MSAQDWILLLGAGGLFTTGIIAGVAKAAVEIIKAQHENISDRAAKSATSNVQLAAIAEATGAPVTVPQPEKAAVAVTSGTGGSMSARLTIPPPTTFTGPGAPDKTDGV